MLFKCSISCENLAVSISIMMDFLVTANVYDSEARKFLTPSGIWNILSIKFLPLKLFLNDILQDFIKIWLFIFIWSWANGLRKINLWCSFGRLLTSGLQTLGLTDVMIRFFLHKIIFSELNFGPSYLCYIIMKSTQA